MLPSASKTEIGKAYKVAAKRWHPDKCSNGQGDATMFRNVKDAFEALKKPDSTSSSSSAQPFDALLKDIHGKLRVKVREYLSEQRYEPVETLLFQLCSLHELDKLVSPPLNSKQTSAQITKIVRGHVSKVKVEVDSNWTQRKYRALNDNMTDLKAMQDNFKEYPHIFPSSWNREITESIETEIESLGKRASAFLRTHSVAKQNVNDFRRCFIDMGCVLIELPTQKDFTQGIMASVLETCLESEWGHGYLFELGLSLQRGDEKDSEEHTRVAQALVAEFSHFKEVMTMVWNEEVTQKPAEDTVCDIKGEERLAGRCTELEVDRDGLLDSFRVFDAEYKTLLGQYISPEADLSELVRSTAAIANQLQPLSCSSGWGVDVKRQLPKILAGVFAVFTVLKSGASYNRLGAAAGVSKIGQNVLKKPHNIQALTVLCMLGCGAPSRSTLDSQLFEIRTGEGKSMLLGAAAAVLALLGFRARCVCYSEYLSDRDYELFKDVFCCFHLTDSIKYSKITVLSEDTTAAKGNIRELTESLLRSEFDPSTGAVSRNKSKRSRRPTNSACWQAARSTGSGASTMSTEQETPAETDVSTSQRTKKRGGRKKKKKKSNASAALCSRVGDACAAEWQVKIGEEILLVDEVDVFFGSNFYGQTYNQVAQVREPEVATILQQIWNANKRGGRRQRLADVQATPAYVQLLVKLPRYAFLLDNEISLMLDQVRRVDEEPAYHLDPSSDRIGYKVMDTISYEATYGYRTVFAYLKEADKGKLKNKDSTLASVLTMPVSCGQFSYADIKPARILGVSGTLNAMGDYEKDVMAKYGIEKFMFVPSVYGKSNFGFDKGGEGICIEANESDYFHSIITQIQETTKQKRAVIVFFANNARMKVFTTSAFYRKLGRQKKTLTEEMSAADKEFVINKAATAGQITICSAVFGRGTDFFCKDERVQKNGGVHVIQAFLSAERSEEIQLQGRTARQGEKLGDASIQKQKTRSFGLPTIF